MILESLVLMTGYLFAGCGGESQGKEEITVKNPTQPRRFAQRAAIESESINKQDIKYNISTNNGEEYLETAKKLEKGECMEIYWSDRIKFETLNNEEYESKISETDKYTHYTCKK